MATKTSKKTSEKSDLKSKTSTSSQKTKKVVVKRRTADLSPTKASAVAIASQANRAKKQEFIDRIASEKTVVGSDKSTSSKIPLWVWLFFGGSLLLFCISFYQAIIRPQLANNEVVDQGSSGVYRVWEWEERDNSVSLNDNNAENQNVDNSVALKWDKTDIIVRFFDLMSSRDFNGAFDLFSSALQNTADIRAHFTEYRMSPFLWGIEWWKLQPTDFEYKSTSEYGNDKYSFNLSYVLSSTQERYDEKWEVVIDERGDEPKIASIVCVTSRCSYHPIFWPENFGLMK